MFIINKQIGRICEVLNEFYELIVLVIIGFIFYNKYNISLYFKSYFDM